MTSIYEAKISMNFVNTIQQDSDLAVVLQIDFTDFTGQAMGHRTASRAMSEIL